MAHFKVKFNSISLVQSILSRKLSTSEKCYVTGMQLGLRFPHLRTDSNSGVAMCSVSAASGFSLTVRCFKSLMSAATLMVSEAVLRTIASVTHPQFQQAHSLHASIRHSTLPSRRFTAVIAHAGDARARGKDVRIAWGIAITSGTLLA